VANLSSDSITIGHGTSHHHAGTTSLLILAVTPLNWNLHESMRHGSKNQPSPSLLMISTFVSFCLYLCHFQRAFSSIWSLFGLDQGFSSNLPLHANTGRFRGLLQQHRYKSKGPTANFFFDNSRILGNYHRDLRRIIGSLQQSKPTLADLNPTDES